jgi:hypothetical protein
MREVAIVTDVPKSQNRPCEGRAVIRHDRNLKDLELRGKPILDDDGRRQYKPCGRPAMNGQTVCAAHGGNAPQAIAAAKRTLALATRNIADVLENIALDETIPPETRIKAAKEIMDRAGIRAGVDLGIETPGWQKVMGKLFGVAEEEDSPAPEPEPEETKAVAPKARKAAPPKPKAAPTRPKLDW